MKWSIPERLAVWLPGAFALATLILFSLFVGWIYATVLDAGRTQHDVRAALTARGSVLRMQLDEETGLRGFTSTVNEKFLEPYVAAASKFDGALENERQTLRALQNNARFETLVDQEAELHRRWQLHVAKPLLQNPNGSDANAEQELGKKLIDGFRAVNNRIADDLLAYSTAVDEQLWATLRKVIGFGLLGATVLLGLSVFLTRYSGHVQQRIEENRLLYENEKRVADSLQEALLAKELPRVPHVRLDAVYKPAEQLANVGGDWYDAFLLPDGRMLISIGDVAGHGLDAAVIMGRARQALLAAALQGNDPSDILALVNRSLMIQGRTMVTAVCGFIDIEAMHLVYSIAGHPPPVYADPSGSRFLQHGGLPLGLLDDAKYQTFTQRVAPQSLLVLYTDGLTEYRRDIRQGEAQLLETVARLAATPGHAAVELHDRLIDGLPATDDIAILALRFDRPARPESAIGEPAAVDLDSLPPLPFVTEGLPREAERPADPPRSARIESVLAALW